MIRTFLDKEPAIAADCYIDRGACVTGDVEIASGCSVWFSAAIRGDIEKIRIGRNSNVQENSSLHVDEGAPLEIGENVTVGHNAVLHGCTVEDNSLIGMGAIVLNRAVIGAGSVVGAGALVTEGKVFPPGSLIVGSPARAIRQLNEEQQQKILRNAEAYVRLGKAASTSKELDQ